MYSYDLDKPARRARCHPPPRLRYKYVLDQQTFLCSSSRVDRVALLKVCQQRRIFKRISFYEILSALLSRIAKKAVLNVLDSSASHGQSSMLVRLGIADIMCVRGLYEQTL